MKIHPLLVMLAVLLTTTAGCSSSGTDLPDAWDDAGDDAGTDAGTDAGLDAGVDGGIDAGDAGSDDGGNPDSSDTDGTADEDPCSLKEMAGRSGLWIFVMNAANASRIVELEPVVQRDYLAGYAATFPLKPLRPSIDGFDPSPIDFVIEVAERNNRKVTIRIDSGPALSKTPDWLLDEFEGYQHVRPTWNAEVKVPYINDPAWLDHILQTHQWLVDRYDCHPAVAGIHLTVLGGEMYFTGSHDEELDALMTMFNKTRDEVEADILDAWQQLFGLYAGANLHTPLSLPITDPISQGASVRNLILAAATETFGPGRLTLENDGASENNPTASQASAGSIRGKMVHYSGLGYPLGFESLPPGWVDDPDGMLDVQRTYDPIYLHLWDEFFSTIDDQTLREYAAFLATNLP